MLLVQKLAASQTGTSDSMVESLGLGLGAGRSSEGGLRFGGRGCRGQKLDLFADGTAEILEGLLDVGRVIVGLVGVLGAVKRNARSTSRYQITTGETATYVTASIFW